ncbi:hypothetical protein MKQ68_07095 [Chitinophaga horti]|uniref:HTH cro/C1-type domain-containing protein n=1 Tax=Chitinophaga horti TaxID=2920382 RepID=A0ABY6J5F8_9BACT|nr:hypothetical protein [Chitinophaga horti]UYQ94857.1 hypothetical protein MKQ68_07095 [Chitinophaga horti]
MKSYKAITKTYKPEEIAASFVFPVEKQKKEEALSTFRHVRKKAEARKTLDEKIVANLLQLKFLIEDYIGSKPFNKKKHFGYFLKEYITRIETKNKDFAEQIGIDPSELSAVINKHREPTDKLIIRLELHSNKNFPAILWLRLVAKEKEYEIMHNKSLRSREVGYVKEKLPFSF